MYLLLQVIDQRLIYILQIFLILKKLLSSCITYSFLAYGRLCQPVKNGRRTLWQQAWNNGPCVVSRVDRAVSELHLRAERKPGTCVRDLPKTRQCRHVFLYRQKGKRGELVPGHQHVFPVIQLFLRDHPYLCN